MGDHLYTYSDPPNQRHIDRACEILRQDGVLAYPTDVNWAFGSLASSRKGMDKIRSLKPTHPKERPFSLICSSLAMASEYGVVDHYSYRFLKKALPGAYTILLPRNKALPRHIKDKRKVVGIRIPQCSLLSQLVETLNEPIATTSVPSIPGRISKDHDGVFRFGYEISEVFSHAVDLILDLGLESQAVETTIVDFTEQPAVIVREGAGNPEIFVF